MKIVNKFILPVCILFLMISCGDMNSLIREDLNKGETIYTGKVDSVEYTPGNNRVKFFWVVNADPRITKTVISWDENEGEVEVPISGRKMEKEIAISEGLHTFELYTMDNEGHRSLSTEISTEIYGEMYASTLSIRGITSMNLSEGPELKLNWTSVSSAIRYTTLQYMDHTVTPAVKRTVRIENDETETILRGVKLEPFTVVTNYLPEGSLDSIDTPARAYIPLVTEGDVLIANGFMEYTAAKTDAVRKLIYPMHTGSFKDVYYFPNLHELDLTGGDIPLSKLAYSRNDVYNEVGGEAGVPFVRKAGSISDENKQIILGLLASGQFTKVRYYPNSMGLDTDFAPYVTSGVVELVNLPTESLIPNQFLLNGIVENVNFTTDITYPATDAPAGTGLQNIYKMKIMVRDGSLLFALPSEYQFNVQEYPYFKFKVCTPPANLLTDDYAIYKKIWVRFMTKLWSFGNNSVFDQELYNVPKGTVTIDDANLHTWVDVTIPLAETVNNHNRVIILTPGEENTTAATFPPAVDRIYYFANIRFSKTP